MEIQRNNENEALLWVKKNIGKELGITYWF
jgi:hypothetical protein